MLTYFEDTDVNILYQLTDRDLYDTCHSSKYLFQLCKQNSFLNDRMTFYHDFLVTVSIWSMPYIRMLIRITVYNPEGDVKTMLNSR